MYSEFLPKTRTSQIRYRYFKDLNNGIAITCICIKWLSHFREGRFRDWIKFNKIQVASIACGVIFLASFCFNLPRWFELRTDARKTGGAVRYFIAATTLRRNASYIQYYSLIGSSVVMVFVPFIALLLAYCSIHRTMVTGNQKKKTLRLMTIIIMLFLICHMPKVNIWRVTPYVISCSLWEQCLKYTIYHLSS